MLMRNGLLFILGFVFAFNRKGCLCGQLPPAWQAHAEGVTKDNLQMLAATKTTSLDGKPSFRHFKQSTLGKSALVSSKINEESGPNSLSDFIDYLIFMARDAYSIAPYDIHLEAKPNRILKTTMLRTNFFSDKGTMNARFTSSYASKYSSGNPARKTNILTFSEIPLVGTNSQMFYSIFPKFLKQFGCEVYTSLGTKSELDHCFIKALNAYYRKNYGLLQALLSHISFPDYRRVTADNFISILSSITTKRSDLGENWEADGNLIDNANTNFTMLNEQIEVPLEGHLDYTLSSKRTLEKDTHSTVMPYTRKTTQCRKECSGNQSNYNTYPEHTAVPFTTLELNSDHLVVKARAHSMFTAPLNGYIEHSLAPKGRIEMETKPVLSVALGMVMPYTNKKDDHVFQKDMSVAFTTLEQNLDGRTIKPKGHSMFVAPLNNHPEYRPASKGVVNMKTKPAPSDTHGIFMPHTNEKDDHTFPEDMAVAFSKLEQNLDSRMVKSKGHSMFAATLNSHPEYALASKGMFNNNTKPVLSVPWGMVMLHTNETDDHTFSEDMASFTMLKQNSNETMTKSKGQSVFAAPLNRNPAYTLASKVGFKMETKPVLSVAWGIVMPHAMENGKDDHTLPEDMAASITMLNQNLDHKITEATGFSMVAALLNNPKYTLSSKVGFKMETKPVLSVARRMVTPHTYGNNSHTIPENMSTAFTVLELNLDHMTVKAKGHSVFDEPVSRHIKNAPVFRDGFKLKTKPLLSVSQRIVMKYTNEKIRDYRIFKTDMAVAYTTLEQNVDNKTASAKALSMLTSPMMQIEWKSLSITPKMNEIEHFQNVNAQINEYTIDDNEDVYNNSNNRGFQMFLEGRPVKGINILILPILGEDDKNMKTLFPMKLNVSQPKFLRPMYRKSSTNMLTNSRPLIQSDTLTSRWLITALITPKHIAGGRILPPKIVPSTIFPSTGERQTKIAKVKHQPKTSAESTLPITYIPFELNITKNVAVGETHDLSSVQLLNTSLFFTAKNTTAKITSRSQTLRFKSNQPKYTKQRTFVERGKSSPARRIHRKYWEVTYVLTKIKQKREIRDYETGTDFLYFSNKLVGVNQKPHSSLLDNPYIISDRKRRSFAVDDNSELFPVILQNAARKTETAQAVPKSNKFGQVKQNFESRSASEKSSNDGTVLLPVGALNHLSSALLAGAVIIGFIFFGCVLGLIWLLHKDSKLCAVLGRCLSTESVPNQSGSHQSAGQPAYKYSLSSGRSQIQVIRSPPSVGVKEIQVIRSPPSVGIKEVQVTRSPPDSEVKELTTKQAELHSNEIATSTDSHILQAPKIQARKSFHFTSTRKPIAASFSRNCNNSGKEYAVELNDCGRELATCLAQCNATKVYTLQFSDSGSRLLTDAFDETRCGSKCHDCDGKQSSPIQKRILYDTSDQEFLSSSESICSCYSRSSYKSVSLSTSDQDTISSSEHLSSCCSKISKKHVLLSSSISDDPYVR